jgi:Protein of unknown function with HXXEE motif
VPSLIDRTHGRWPWLAAVGAVPATVAVARADEPLLWAPVPAYFWHQTEEWVWPGGFLPWVNREVLGSDEDEFPITRRLGCAINTGGGWALATLAGLRGRRSPALGAAVSAMLVANAAFHVRESGRARGYRPGLVTAATLMAPLGLGGLGAVVRRAGARPVLVGATLGLGGSALQIAAIRRRVRR